MYVGTYLALHPCFVEVDAQRIKALHTGDIPDALREATSFADAVRIIKFMCHLAECKHNSLSAECLRALCNRRRFRVGDALIMATKVVEFWPLKLCDEVVDNSLAHRKLIVCRELQLYKHCSLPLQLATRRCPYF